jgi:hypothetical protein
MELEAWGNPKNYPITSRTKKIVNKFTPEKKPFIWTKNLIFFSAANFYASCFGMWKTGGELGNTQGGRGQNRYTGYRYCEIINNN